MSDKEPVRDHFTQGEEGLYTHDTAKRKANKAAAEAGTPKPGEPTEAPEQTPEPPAEK